MFACAIHSAFFLAAAIGGAETSTALCARVARQVQCESALIGKTVKRSSRA